MKTILILLAAMLSFSFVSAKSIASSQHPTFEEGCCDPGPDPGE